MKLYPISSLGSKMVATPISSAEGIECGHYQWSLLNTPEEQGHRYGDYMDRIKDIERWPLALFEGLSIHESSRRRGLGRKGVKQFVQDAKKSGAVCALLKVGWGFSEDPQTARKWKTAFYKSEGFIELPMSGTEPVLMFRSLKTV